MALIYGFKCKCHPDSGIRYVGLTKRTLSVRVNEHVYNSRNGVRLPVYDWMRKHGYENLDPVILEADPADVYQSEVNWISRLRSKGLADLNLSYGGEPGNTGPRSAETRAKMSAAQKGKPKPKPEGFGEKVSAAAKARRGNRVVEERPKKVRKLSETDVLAVLALKGITSDREAGALFGVHRNSVNMIWRGAAWNRVTYVREV